MAFEQRIKDLVSHGDKLFADRLPLMSLWQEIGDHFYPERSHFTMTPLLGRDFAAHLTTSYPLLCRRDLGNSFGAMLRPKGKQWFSIKSAYDDDDDDARAWLERAAKIQRAAMYDKLSRFLRATKEGDHDFAAFGQCVLSVELSKDRSRLLYRCWHLRDVVWAEDAEGSIGTVHRKWEPTIRELIEQFGEGRVDTKLVTAVGKEPFRTVQCRHVVVASKNYAPPAGKKPWKEPFVSITLDVENECVMEEVGIWGRHYIIPRWQTVSGSQYAYSPATIAALPDARLIQAITLTLLQAGERSASPPAIARQGILRSDVDLRSEGVTWVDAEYDEKLGEALRYLETDAGGLPYAIKMRDDTREMIAEALYLNKIGLPPADREMTAFETAQRVNEYIRQALPLFEPMEDDYNGAVCDETFSLMMRNGGFGPRDQIPPSLRGTDPQFHFESPLQKAEDSGKGQLLLDGANLLLQAAQIDPSVRHIPNAPVALRAALRGIGWDATWTNTQEVVDQAAAADAQRAKVAAAAQAIHTAGAVAEQAGNGLQALQTAQAGAALNQTAGGFTERAAA